MVLGEFPDSGYNPGLDGKAKIARFIDHSRTISRRRKNIAPDSGSRLIMGVWLTDLVSESFNAVLFGVVICVFLGIQRILSPP